VVDVPRKDYLVLLQAALELPLPEVFSG